MQKQMTEVKYLGFNLKLPAWVKYLVVNEKGCIVGWNEEPTVLWRYDDWYGNSPLAREEFFGKLTSFNNFDWRNSKAAVSDLVAGNSPLSEAVSVASSLDLFPADKSFSFKEPSATVVNPPYREFDSPKRISILIVENFPAVLLLGLLGYVLFQSFQ